MADYYLAYTYPHGISLNGREYLLDEEGNLIKFPTKWNLMKYLRNQGLEFDDIDELEEKYIIRIEEVWEDIKDRVLEAVEEGTLDRDVLIMCFVKALSVDDIKEILKMNEIYI